MMARPARSFTEPPELRNSALPRIVQPVVSEARRNLISGVRPIVPITSRAKRDAALTSVSASPECITLR
jgi:hypothetical protein